MASEASGAVLGQHGKEYKPFMGNSMITATVEKTNEGKYKVADQATGEVYGLLDAKGDAVDLVRAKTGDMDVTILICDD